MSVKKAIIKKQELPPLSLDGEYLLRYRILSEDKNRSSHWSPIYKVDAKPLISTVSGNLLINQNAITVVWGNQNMSPGYDIFIKFNFDVEHKQLTSNVATIFTKNLTDIAVNDTITVSGVGVPFDGVHKVTAISTANKSISYSVVNSNISYGGSSGSVTLGYLYHGTSTTHSYGLLANLSAKSVEAIVQIHGMEKALSTVLEIFESPSPVTI